MTWYWGPWTTIYFFPPTPNVDWKAESECKKREDRIETDAKKEIVQVPNGIANTTERPHIVFSKNNQNGVSHSTLPFTSPSRHGAQFLLLESGGACSSLVTNRMQQHQWHVTSEARTQKVVQLLPSRLHHSFGVLSHYIRGLTTLRPPCCEKAQVTWRHHVDVPQQPQIRLCWQPGPTMG